MFLVIYILHKNYIKKLHNVKRTREGNFAVSRKKGQRGKIPFVATWQNANRPIINRKKSTMRDGCSTPCVAHLVERSNVCRLFYENKKEKIYFAKSGKTKQTNKEEMRERGGDRELN